MQQLVHFGQLLTLDPAAPRPNPRPGALHAAATLTDLAGAAATARTTAGMPAYALGTETITEHLPHTNTNTNADGNGTGDRAKDGNGDGGDRAKDGNGDGDGDRAEDGDGGNGDGGGNRAEGDS